MNWIHLAQDKHMWWTLTNMEKSFRHHKISVISCLSQEQLAFQELCSMEWVSFLKQGLNTVTELFILFSVLNYWPLDATITASNLAFKIHFNDIPAIYDPVFQVIF